MTEIIGVGSRNYIGLVDEATVLKYPHLPRGPPPAKASKIYERWRSDAEDGLDAEEKMLQAIGPHPRIVGFKARRDDGGLLLEYMANGMVGSYLHEKTSIWQRLQWTLQATEAVAFIHSRDVLHCDLNVYNMLLDAGLNIKLCDFQGRLLSPNGDRVLCNGGSSEGTKYSMPRADPEDASRKSDIFALGSVMYFLMTGHEVYPGLHHASDEDEIVRRFQHGDFPPIDTALGREIMYRCWLGEYESAQDMANDVADLLHNEGIAHTSSTSSDSSDNLGSCYRIPCSRRRPRRRATGGQGTRRRHGFPRSCQTLVH